MEFQITRVSQENIKPSSPTPPHLRNKTLSFLDQNTAPQVSPRLIFYDAPKGSAPLDITRLKTCLSQTLTTFYPLAGRYQTWGTILCNDQGIPFVEAQVSCPLSDFLSSIISSSTIGLNSFYPPKEDLIASGIHLAIQLNVFTCGGFAIGWYHTHKVTDGTSAATFFRYWTALVTQRYEDAAQVTPDFDAGVIAFPPVSEEELPVRPVLNNDKQETEAEEKQQIVLRSFVLNAKAVTELKAKSVSDEVPNPSRFVSVVGFLWKRMLLASPTEGRSMLTVSVELRSRSDPPLPKGSIGNLIETAFVQVEKQAQLPELVASIYKTISKTKDIALEYQSARRADAKEKYRQTFRKAFFECQPEDIYCVTSSTKTAGFGDMDFGFGKPKWIVPTDGINKSSRNVVVLTDYPSSEGDKFEAWMSLERKTAMFMESNTEFLAFATPNFKLDDDRNVVDTAQSHI